jgi:aminomethyltransferase
MPIPTPFHSRTAPLNRSFEWRNWSGYLSASLYQVSHEPEYYAIRNAAALIDASPLYKYEVVGADSVRLLNRIMTRDISKCVVGQVMYSPWCDDDGKVIDDGTVARLERDRFRVTAADPNLAWFQDAATGMDVRIEDVSDRLAALAIQGPNSRAILKETLLGMDLDRLRYYRLAQGYFGDVPLTVTRTGYTGDLGYEVWIAPEHADPLWDLLYTTGEQYGLLPAGIVALDISRIEAGMLLIEVDYISSRKAVIPEQTSSPLELGLSWTVNLNKGYFIGRDALREEQQRGSKWDFIGLEVDWTSLESLFARVDLPPKVAGRASRSAVPIYKNGRQIGQATSHTFSPILKKYIALASVLKTEAQPGNAVKIEITVEYARQTANAVVTAPQFYNPPRKRA